MYVTTHDTAKFSLLTYLMTNNTVSSTSGEYGLQQYDAQLQVTYPLKLLRNAHLSWVTSCFLNSTIILFLSPSPSYRSDMVWYYRFKNVCIYDGQIQKSQNNHMCHLLLDLHVLVYDLHIWFAKSTLPMFWLCNFTSRGHATSIQLPSGNRQDTTSVCSSLKMVST